MNDAMSQAEHRERSRTDAAPRLVQAEDLDPQTLLLRVCPDCERITNLGKTTLYAAIARGDLKATRFGRSVRVHRDDLAAFIAAARD